MRSVVRGGRWLFLAQVAVNGMMLVRTMILVRLLVPWDFGIWAAIFATLQVLRTFSSEKGVTTVAIQHKEGDSEEILMTAWWMNALRGVLLACVLFASAGLLARWFIHDPEINIGYVHGLTRYFWLVSLVFVLEGFVSPGIIRATRKLAFNRLVLVQQGSTMLSVILAIVLGYYLRNVKALVFAEVIRVLLLLVFSFFILPVKLSFKVTIKAARSLWSRSWHLYLAEMSHLLILHGIVQGQMFS